MFGGAVYEVVVVGRAERTVRIALEGLVDEWRDGPEQGTLAAMVDDQSRLVAVIERLHDLGICIDRVRQL